MKRDHTRPLLLKAAKEIIESDGYDAVTVRRISEITGYTYPLLYHYFKDLNNLLWSLRLEMIEDMVTELTQTMLSQPHTIEDLKTMFRQYSSYFYRHPNIFRFFYFYPFKMPENNEEYGQLEHEFTKMWHTSFTFLVQNNDIEAGRVEIVAKTIIFSLHGMIMMSLSSNGSLTEEAVNLEIDQIISFLLTK